MSRWQDIFLFLDAKGIKVYSPGQHEGECTEPYVVVKDDGASRFGNYSSTQNLYSFLCYVPRNMFSQLEPFVDEIESLLGQLYPMLRSVHYRTPSFYDDSVKAHMISTQYVTYHKYTH